MFSRVLSDDQMEQIHVTSLELLERVGVAVPHAEILGRFNDSGARVDFEHQRVHIPPELVCSLWRRPENSLHYMAGIFLK